MHALKQSFGKQIVWRDSTIYLHSNSGYYRQWVYGKISMFDSNCFSNALYWQIWYYNFNNQRMKRFLASITIAFIEMPFSLLRKYQVPCEISLCMIANLPIMLWRMEYSKYTTRENIKYNFFEHKINMITNYLRA